MRPIFAVVSKYLADDAAESQPVVAGGMAYITALDGVLYAYRLG